MLRVYASQDPVSNDFSNFLLNYGVYLAIGVAVILATSVIVFLFLRDRDKNKKLPNKSYSQNDILNALGGKENIIFHERNGSRISMALHDYKAMNEKRLNELGVDSIIKMSNKITLVVKDDPETFYSIFKN